MKLNKSLLSVHQYSLDGEVSGSDYVIGEDANSGFETKNFTFNQISVEVWGVGQAGQVLTATGDGRYVWTDDASESDIPATTTSTTAAPTTTTTTSAISATTTTTATASSTPNTSVPDICLSSYNPVTFSTINGVNSYVFSGTYGSYKVTTGTYTLTGVPSTHPIAILNSGKTSAISYTGTTSRGSKTALDGQTYTYYYGDITITVNSDFGTVSYECYNHGYMGGQNNLSYDASCVQPVTTTTTSAPITTTTTAFVNPIENVCYKDGEFWNRVKYQAGSSAYSAIHNGLEEFFPKFDINYFKSSGGVRRNWQFSKGDKFLYKGTCYTVECSYTSIPRRGGTDLTRILSDGTFMFELVPPRYIEGPCVDPDPDNITATTTTTQAPTTTTTTPAPTTTTTTQGPFVFPEACHYAKWSATGMSGYGRIGECLSENSSHINIHWQYVAPGIKRYMIKGKRSGCTEFSQSQHQFTNSGEIILINFYNVNNVKIGPDYYYKTVLYVAANQGEMNVNYNNLGLHANIYYLNDVDLLGNKPFDDLGYSGLNQYKRVDLRNITLVARHTNSGGNNGCLITLPPSLTTTTTTTAP